MPTAKKITIGSPKKKTAAKKTKPVAKKAAAKTGGSPGKFVAHTTGLKEGDKAPYFQGIDQFGHTVSLDGLKGKTVILYFYPKDDTPSCTAEACSLRDEHQYLTKHNHVVIGVSADTEKAHKKFTAKYELPFSLLPDPEHRIIGAYDVWGTKMFMGRIYDGIIRTTFIIDGQGLIKKVIRDVNTKGHGQQVLEP